ncbi:ABC transporter permease subunit [Lipingzhangella sp. LS1_29]|uniref:ABC transporter permease subunit n=1 Tax=Lipingzhangella rawalii TaxID=2055835 RepID=A0ABU2H712_9ACTN|nr:ABC transporter permease subunit [Lipingzhangella rawalii]MDS1271102.1 ABC transporter permease subunit [Lipingzhangella rawalii]
MSPEVQSNTPPPAGLRATGRGRFADPIFRWSVTVAACTVFVVLALMVLRTTQDAWPIFRSEGFFGFLLGDQWSSGTSRVEVTGEYGALPFIYGTLVTSAIAIALALPLAILTALYITQLAPQRLRNTLSYTVEMLAAIPSVVFGLWGLWFFLPVFLRPLQEFLSSHNHVASFLVLLLVTAPFVAYLTRALARRVWSWSTHLRGRTPADGPGGVPLRALTLVVLAVYTGLLWLRVSDGMTLFHGQVYGFSYLSAGVVLAVMILPIMTAIIREVIAVHAVDHQHAAYAMGATRHEVITRLILPASFSGIVGATMLGLGRALGETIAVLMLVGGSQRAGDSLLFPGDTMAAHIAATFQDATQEAIWGLMAIGVALFIVTMIVNIAARLLVWRVGRLAGKGAAAA